MTISMTVRAAAEGDAADIARLFTQLGYQADAGAIATRLGADLTALVAHDGDAIHGVLVMHVFAPLQVPDPWAVISALVVDETRRSSGAGALLIAAAEAEAKRHACAHLELSCSEKRTRAHAFYEAQGFLERRKRFVKPLR
jgi:GNAT superfamily N-acetyltransferase